MHWVFQKNPSTTAGFGPTLIGLFSGCYLISDIDEIKYVKNSNKLNMAIKFLNLKLLFLIILSSTYIFKNAFSEENYIVTIVNKIPITKVDIFNRAS